MIQPKWSTSLQKWHIDLYSGTKRVKTFWSGKPGKQGRDEVIRKYEAYIGGGDTDITVNGEFARFLEDYKAKVAPETYIAVKNCAEHHILSKIGARRLRTMKITDFQAVINSARKADGSPLAKATLMDIRAILVRFLKYATLDGCNVPPYAALFVPKGAQTIGRKIIPTEAIAALTDDSRVNTGNCFYVNYYRFLLYTGCRPGEALGLRFSDIDSNGFVTIRRSINTHYRITECKNKRAQRRFKLPKKALEVIEDQKRFTGWRESEYIFCGYDGEAARWKNAYRAWLYLSKKIGAEGTSLYSFRHTFVSRYGASLPLPYLKTIIGHGVDMNTYHYYHESDEQTAQAASILDRVNENFH